MSVIGIIVKTNSVAANDIAERKHVDCKEQWTKDRPLGESKASIVSLHKGKNCILFVRQNLNQKRAEPLMHNVPDDQEEYYGRQRSSSTSSELALLSIVIRRSFTTGYSDFSGIESPRPRLKGFK